MDKLAATTGNRGFVVVEAFANCLNLPPDFSTTPRRLNAVA